MLQLCQWRCFHSLSSISPTQFIVGRFFHFKIQLMSPWNCYQAVPHAEDLISWGFGKISFPRPMLNVIFKIFIAEFNYIFSTSWRHKQNVLSSTRRPVCVSLVEIDLVQIQLKWNKWFQIHSCLHTCEHLHWSTWFNSFIKQQIRLNFET